MKVKCTNCNTVLKIDDSKVTATPLLIACPQCQQKMRVNEVITPCVTLQTPIETIPNEDKTIEPFPAFANDIEKYVATTDEFWKTFHESLSATYSTWNAHKNVTLGEWIGMCNNTPDLISHLNLLFEYPILKGEFLLSFYNGFVLTNYRLLINDVNAGKPSIPLSKIKSFNANRDGVIEYESNNQILKLQYQSFLTETIVNAAIARNDVQSLNETQFVILKSSFYDLKKKYSGINIPQVTLSYFKKEKIATDVNTLNSSLTQKPVNKFVDKYQKSRLSKTSFQISILIGMIFIFYLIQTILFATSFGMIVGNVVLSSIAALIVGGIAMAIINRNSSDDNPKVNFKTSWRYSLIALLIFGCFFAGENKNVGSTSSSTSSSTDPYRPNQIHHCKYCDKEFRGPGYVHVLNQCIQQEQDAGMGDIYYHSEKCCRDANPNSSGYNNNSNGIRCPNCGGTGRLPDMYGNYQACQLCDGKGYQTY